MSDALAHFLDVAKRELNAAAERVDAAAVGRAVSLIRKAESEGGRVHVTGIGKPEHLARYGASLLSSTGTPAAFLHGTETTHGSVGQTRAGDVVIAISTSGSTAELLACTDALVAFGAKLIAITGFPDSPLARKSDVVLEAHVGEEGGPLGLAPRASYLAQTLVLCALSVALEEAGGLTRTDCHERHPAGALGKKSGD